MFKVSRFDSEFVLVVRFSRVYRSINKFGGCGGGGGTHLKIKTIQLKLLKKKCGR